VISKGGAFMKFSLRIKLSVSYVFVALLLVSLLIIVTNVLLDKQFQTYIKNNQEQKNNDIVNLVSKQYKEDGKWENTVIENIGINALGQGMIVKVTDLSGKVIWDATEHNDGVCKEMVAHMAKNMSSHYPNWEGGYIANNFSIYHNLKEVGKVEIGYYGPFYFNDNDLAFINTLNRLLISVGIISLLFAIILGVFMAKRLSTPISRTIKTAQMISAGYFGDRITVKSSTKEISQLTSTINNLAETLEKQETLRKRLSADVAHELRTPLATLQSHMEAMIDGIWKPDNNRLKSCHEEIMRINRMVGDLEKLAKFEGENLVLNKSRFDISELIQQTIHNFETEYKRKGIEINFYGEKEEVIADKDKISQVLINLISNALKYTKNGGVVEIDVKGASDITEISVKDNGKGIPEDDLPYIFERFYRADKSRNRLTGGSGIGLTITKAIVDAHKGTIMVQSKIDEGTEVVVALPK
jgi:two-component system, OmpR family, sensor histidine kinase BaeS